MFELDGECANILATVFIEVLSHAGILQTRNCSSGIGKIQGSSSRFSAGTTFVTSVSRLVIIVLGKYEYFVDARTNADVPVLVF